MWQNMEAELEYLLTNTLCVCVWGGGGGGGGREKEGDYEKEDLMLHSCIWQKNN